MVVHGLNDKMQSAYKSGLSTETALLRLKNDLMMAIDGRKAVILVLSDVSAAFGSIDHEIMCSRLERLLGLIGKTSGLVSLISRCQVSMCICRRGFI